MSRVFLSILIVFVVVGGLAVYQATQQTASAVMVPSELLTEKSPAKLARVRVGGKVTSVTKYTLEPTIELLFTIEDPGKLGEPSGSAAVPVVYYSLKPDMFTEGRDVIIEGEFTNGLLKANKLLTQCPSKYEPPSPGAENSENKNEIQKYNETYNKDLKND